MFLPKVSTIIVKRKGEIGPPCHIPLDIVKKPSKVPLIKSDILGVVLY